VKKAKRITATEAIFRANRRLETRNEELVQTLRLAKQAIVWLSANRKGSLQPPQMDIVEQIDRVLSASGANGYADPVESMGEGPSVRDLDF
jgi:hypothetical protein